MLTLAKLVVGLRGLLLLAVASAQGPLEQSWRGLRDVQTCQASSLGDSVYARLADSLDLYAGRGAEKQLHPNLRASTASVNVGRSCVQVVALDWDGELGGGVLVLDVKGGVLDAETEYPGARAVVAAGRGRVAFTYTAVKGSGVYDAEHVVLCPLSRDAWVECFRTTADRLARVSGVGPSDTAAFGMMMEQFGELHVVGDTAVITRRIVYQKYGQRHPEEFQQGVSRVLLPH